MPFQESDAVRLENHTPFVLAQSVLLDKQAAERLVIVLKSTFNIAENGKLEIAEVQEPIRPVDEFYGEPGQSSVRYEAELGPPKLATDVVLLGSAVASQPGTTRMDVALRVGPLTKCVRVFGERRWKNALLGYSISRPLPFDRIPLRYENAYGGSDTSAKNPKAHGREARNPVGRGYRARKSELKFTGELLPNIEDPDQLLSQPGGKGTPQGFGFVGRDWEPRARYMGTYDQNWQETRMPLLPLDFDDRYHNAAHPDLIAPGYLKGATPVQVGGCTPGGRLSFAVPTIEPVATVLLQGVRQPVVLNLNTLLVDTDTMKLILLWKGDLNVHHRLMQVSAAECRLASG